MSLDRRDWITRDQYNKRSNGEPFRSIVGNGPSITSFPAASSTVVGNISQNVTAASRRIKLQSDRWPLLSSASSSGPVAEVIRADVIVSRNVETCNAITSGEYMARLVTMNYVVDVTHRVRRGRSRKTQASSRQTVRFGPLLEDDKEGGGGLKLVPPGTLMDAMQTAERLLVYKDQNHAICRTEGELVADVFLQLLYRNDSLGILGTLLNWKRVINHFESLKWNIPPDDALLNSLPPEIWIASSGGGGITAGEKGCPSFASSRARKDLPDVYIPGGKRDTPENRALDSVYLRKVSASGVGILSPFAVDKQCCLLMLSCLKGVIRVHMKLDPSDKFTKEKRLLPEDIVEIVSAYLGTYHVCGSVDGEDKIEAILRDLAPLGLTEHEMKHAMFRLENHTMLQLRPLVTPRTLLQSGDCFNR